MVGCIQTCAPPAPATGACHVWPLRVREGGKRGAVLHSSVICVPASLETNAIRVRKCYHQGSHRRWLADGL